MIPMNIIWFPKLMVLWSTEVSSPKTPVRALAIFIRSSCKIIMPRHKRGNRSILLEIVSALLIFSKWEIVLCSHPSFRPRVVSVVHIFLTPWFGLVNWVWCCFRCSCCCWYSYGKLQNSHTVHIRWCCSTWPDRNRARGWEYSVLPRYSILIIIIM